MKNKAIRLGKYATLFLMLLIVGYSCSDTNPSYSYDYEEIRRMIQDEIKKNNLELEFTQWEIVNIGVKKSDWTWNNDAGRYEAVFNLPELTKFIYENGAQIGYVFIGQQGKDEVQIPMPFLNTYSDKDNDGNYYTYTETISCDYQLGSPSTVAFHIQGSDLGKDDFNLANYNFRIVLIW